MFKSLLVALFLLISSCFGRHDIGLLPDGYITSSENKQLKNHYKNKSKTQKYKAINNLLTIQHMSKEALQLVKTW
jgi:hypothetical protein